MSFKETRQGAVNRALGAWEYLPVKDRRGMAVGIESGVDLRLEARESLGSILRSESANALHSDAGGGGYDALVTGGIISREELQIHPTLSAIMASLRDQKIGGLA